MRYRLYCVGCVDDVQIIVHEMSTVLSIPRRTDPAAVARTTTAAGREKPKRCDQRLLCSTPSCAQSRVSPKCYFPGGGEGERVMVVVGGQDA